MTEWRQFKLKDILEPDGYIRGPFGSSLRRGELKNEGIPVYEQEHAIKGIRKFRYYIDQNKFNELKRFCVKTGDIIISCSGTVGEVSVIKEEDPKGIISQALLILRADKNVAYQPFLKYFLMSPYGKSSITSRSDGSVQVNIAKRQVIENIDILLPPLPEQKAIAEVLSSLDDKIDLLTRQNKTLEDLAQAYFRKWFIEDASDEWEVVPISEKFDVLLGGTPSRKIESYWTNGTIGWINSGKINEFRIIEASEYITEEALNNSSAKLLPAGTTVLAITGATLGKISMVLRSFAANQSVIGLVPKAELSNNFIFLWLKENINALISMQTGGAQQHINSNDVKSFDVIVPDTVALSLFRRKIDPLMLKISQNCFQINTLNKLRDTLLPKLISGEIRVKM
jgi:type I restriction enzyme S subunit